jgi:hypothetical protein
MKKNRFIRALALCALTLLGVACSKTADPVTQNCSLASVVNARGETTENLTYDAQNRLITYAVNSSDLVFAFTYNGQNTVDKINITDKTAASKPLTLEVTFSYDGSGRASSAITTVNGTKYQTNTFTYTGSQLSVITTQDGTNTLKTRFEYAGENVRKVFQQFDRDPEYLYYEITQVDDKLSASPEAYRAITLGLTGLFDAYSFMCKNNPLSEKYYDDDNQVFYTVDFAYEYNASMKPSRISRTTIEDGDKSTTTEWLSYLCK